MAVRVTVAVSSSLVAISAVWSANFVVVFWYWVHESTVNLVGEPLCTDPHVNCTLFSRKMALINEKAFNDALYVHCLQ